MTTELVIGIASSLFATALLFFLARVAGVVLRRMRGLRGRLRLARYASDLGVIHLFSTRAGYQRIRGTATLADYFRLASRRIGVVAYSLSFGQHSQGVADEVESILGTNPSLEIEIALIDPRSPHIASVGKYLKGFQHGDGGGGGDPRAWFRSQVVGTLEALSGARDRMPGHLRARFRLKVYDILPVASVIMLDRGYERGRTQVDIKLFGRPSQRSFSFELSSGGELYNAVTEAWGKMIENAEAFDPATHLTQDVMSDVAPSKPELRSDPNAIA